MHNQEPIDTERGMLHGCAPAVMACLLFAEHQVVHALRGLRAAGNDGSPSHSSTPGGMPGASGGATDPVTPLRKQLGGLRTPGRAGGYGEAPAADSSPLTSGR